MAIVDLINKFIKPSNDKKEGDDQAISDSYKNARRFIKIVQWFSNPASLVPIIIIVFLIIMFPVFFSPTTGTALNGGSDPADSSGNPGSGGSGPTVPAIQGFSVLLTGPETKANGEKLIYTVTITYDPDVATVPLENIEIYDVMPSGVTFGGTNGVLKDPSANPHIWALSESANKNGFEIELNPEVTDTVVTYTVNARATGGSGGSSGNSCTEPYEGTGYCSVGSLAPTFGGDQTKALIASMICQAESRSNPFALNSTCPDYSVGLFQINLVAHCPGAYSNQNCSALINESARDACETTLKDPLANIQKMYAISAGTYWTPWSTWPGVQSKLQSCGIL